MTAHKHCAYNEGGLICTKIARKKSDFCHAHRPSGKLRISNHTCPDCRGEKRIPVFGDELCVRDCPTCGGIGRTLVVNQRKSRVTAQRVRS
jgi:DnaJ-class molecular chaperone